jgi:hypothetical protein
MTLLTSGLQKPTQSLLAELLALPERGPVAAMAAWVEVPHSVARPFQLSRRMAGVVESAVRPLLATVAVAVGQDYWELAACCRNQWRGRRNHWRGRRHD